MQSLPNVSILALGMLNGLYFLLLYVILIIQGFANLDLGPVDLKSVLCLQATKRY